MAIGAKFILLLVFVFKASILPSQEIVLNGGLDNWANGKIEHVTSLSGSADHYRSGYRIHPPYSLEDSLRNFLPLHGIEGNTYCGMYSSVLVYESMVFKLEEKNISKGTYVLSLYARSLALDSYSFSDTIPVVLLDSIPLRPSKVKERDFEIHVSQLMKKGAQLESNSMWGNWHYFQTTLELNGNEKYIAIGPPIPQNTGQAYYYLMDEIQLMPKIENAFTIHFETGESDIDLIQKEELTHWLEALKYYDVESIEISGYADKKGDSGFNKTLSQDRINTTLSILNNFFSEDMIKEFAHGESQSYGSEGDWRFRKVVVEFIEKRPRVFKAKDIPINVLKEIQLAFKKDQSTRMSQTTHETQPYSIDSENKDLLKKIIDNYGFIGLSHLGQETKDYMAVLMLHQDISFIKDHFDLVKKAVNLGECSRSLLPYFVDKIKVAEGKPQIFGTQCYYSEKEQKYIPYELHNSYDVDKYRKSYMLSTLESYLSEMNNPENSE